MSKSKATPKPFNPPKPEAAGGTEVAQTISQRKTRSQILAEKRARRKPLSDDTDRFYILNKDPSMEYRIVNDDRGGARIRRFQQAGWDFVTKADGVVYGQQGVDANTSSDIGSGYGQYVGMDYQNKPMNGYLMCIEKELYDEDDARKQRKQDAILGEVDPNKESTNHYYGKIKINDRRKE